MCVSALTFLNTPATSPVWARCDCLKQFARQALAPGFIRHLRQSSTAKRSRPRRRKRRPSTRARLTLVPRRTPTTSHRITASHTRCSPATVSCLITSRNGAERRMSRERSLGQRRESSWACRKSSTLATSRPAGIGDTRRITSRPCG